MPVQAASKALREQPRYTLTGNYRALTLILAVAMSYLFYAALAMPALSEAAQECLYQVWVDDRAGKTSPYWMFVYLVRAFMLLAVALIVTSLIRRQKHLLNIAAGLLLLLVLSMWSSDLNSIRAAANAEAASRAADISPLPDLPMSAARSCQNAS